MSNQGKLAISNDELQAICDTHGLGKIDSAVWWAGHGRNNPVSIINDRYVMRFDGLDLEGRSRYFGEKLAYESLRARGIPAPEVIALDVSRTLAPRDYLILSKIEGQPVADSWKDLSPVQREQVGYEAGTYLAMMHEITLHGYGHILKPENERFSTWYEHVMDNLQGYYLREAVTRQIMTSAERDGILAVFEKHKPILVDVHPARLVHWDYHFSNIMQQNGHITGILDFEWALAGDAMFDLNLRDYWEERRPGSRAPMMKGYTDQRSLPADSEARIALYQIVMLLDDFVDAVSAEDRKTIYDEIWAALKVVT